MDRRLTIPQDKLFFSQSEHIAAVAGYGCLRGSTKVVTDQGLIPICDIEPLTRVLSWNKKDQKYQLSLSAGSFLKGKDYLYRVVTQQGEFVASGNHRVLSSSCIYLRVDDLEPGQCLSWTDQKETIEAVSQKSLLLNVLHLKKKVLDYLLNYAYITHQYGQQLLLFLSNVLIFSPSLNGVPLFDRNSYLSVQSNVDDLLGQLHKRNHRDQFFSRLKKKDYYSQSALLEEVEEGLTSTLPLAHISVFSQQLKRFLSKIFCRCIKKLFYPNSNFLDFSCVAQLISLELSDCFYIKHLKHILQYILDLLIQLFQKSIVSRQIIRVCHFYNFLQQPLRSTKTSNKNTIISVTRLNSEEYYYDMHVFNTNNYVTEEGSIHHNSGKSEVIMLLLMTRMTQYRTIDFGYFAPTYSDIRDIFYPRISEILDELQITFSINRTEHIVKTQGLGNIICKSLDDPYVIKGFEIGDAFIDEFDILPTDKAKLAYNKIAGRCRSIFPDGKINQKYIATTPEGFKATYDLFKKNPLENSTIVQMSTYSNAHNLPPGYIKSLKSQFPEQLFEAYINGKFVNLVSGTVYHSYNDSCSSNLEHISNEPIHIGMDFNVRNMSAIVNVQRDGVCHAVDELIGVLDTPTMIDLIKDRYYGCSIIVRPDASGKNVSSKGASLSDIRLLQQAGFWVDAPTKNPRIKDRVNSVNIAFEKGQQKVNQAKCPQLHLALQQQIYDKNGMPEKRLDSNIDDIVDSFGYNVYGLYPLDKYIKLNNKGNWK